MVLFSPFIWPLFLIGLSMLITYLTALDLPSKLRRSRGIGPAGEGDSIAPAIVTAKLPVSVRIARNGGIFWFCAGVAKTGCNPWPYQNRHSGRCPSRRPPPPHESAQIPSRSSGRSSAARS